MAHGDSWDKIKNTIQPVQNKCKKMFSQLVNLEFVMSCLETEVSAWQQQGEGPRSSQTCHAVRSTLQETFQQRYHWSR